MSVGKKVHIVSHDVPYPLDYGGVLDIFSTIKALHEEGIEIILHCFEYGRGEQPVLNQFCKEVYYYKRLEGHKGFCFHLPYIVASRTSQQLFDRLSEDNHPILLQGIHSSGLLEDPRFSDRRIVLRLFNVETTYYKELARHERSVFKKAYYLYESSLLQKQEQRVAQQLPVLTLSEKDKAYYKNELRGKQVEYVPVLHPFMEVKSQEGVGSFCLYHGNLGVAENEKAAIWLLKEVFDKVKIPLVIAGKNPSHRLQRIAHRQTHTCLVSNPEERELQELIQQAQINILPSFNKTGIKLKLLNALYNGRHCVVNQHALDGSPLAPLCHIAGSAAAVQRLVQQLFHHSFGEEEIRLRKNLLGQHFNTAANARTLIQYLL